jgi:hypothetical protein
VKLDELLETVVNSDADEWNVIYCWGAGSGPSYRGRPAHEVEEMRDEDGRFDVHGMTAAYKQDVSVTLAWGLTSRAEFHADWAKVFPEKVASSCFADLFYNGALVHRQLYVVVDDGRSYLPLPNQVGGTEVDRFDYDFVRLVDHLEILKISEYEGYFERSGLTVAS